MGEIKFRGKSLNREWLYGYLLKWKDGATYILHSENENEEISKEEVNPVTVGQFTGLRDKNGVEIYEGDIFTTPQNKWVVKGDVRAYCYDAECLTQKHLTRTLLGLCTENVNIEIIGNIHDNPELLKGGKQ